jgi:alanine racemase
MVMNPEQASFENIENYNLEPEIYSFDILSKFEKYCEAQGINQYPVHIKLDTGMHRLGFEMQEVEKLGKRLSGQDVLVVKTVFTHLAASEDPKHDAFTAEQANEFVEACKLLEQKLGYSFIKHAANTAAIRRHPDKHFDMVRLGIGLYGVDEHMPGLQVVSTLKTTVAQVKKVPVGQTVGYGRRGIVTRDSIIATVRIGYADGLSRHLGNGIGSMLFKDKEAPIIGNVCMDMTMLNVTDIPGVKAGDIVEVFGQGIKVQQVASQCETIPYEIMTGISQRVKRVYLQE